MIQAFTMKDLVELKIEKSRKLEDSLNFKQNKFKVEHYRKGVLLAAYDFPNDVTNEGKNLILDVMFNTATQIANNSWFLGIINNAGYSTVAAGDVMNSHGGWAEFTAYNEATRVAWGSGASSGQQVTNASAATFTINTGPATLKGVFVTSNSTKGGTSGKLWATALFASTVSVDNTDQLKVTYTVAC